MDESEEGEEGEGGGKGRRGEGKMEERKEGEGI